jgi:hypothetical protein
MRESIPWQNVRHYAFAMASEPSLARAGGFDEVSHANTFSTTRPLTSVNRSSRPLCG